jgi:rfaE bifunctional protein nucleotidyltransferase chain/domain
MPNFDTTNWRTEKILTTDEAVIKAAELKQAGKRVVSVNGSFDIVHVGHLDQLEEAKKQGDILFVGINSDRSVKEKKGDMRPIIPEQPRAAMLAALACVDYVIIMNGEYDKEPMQTLLPAVKPDVHVNGPDRGAPVTWVEWPTMREYGIKGYMVPQRNDFSTTALLERIKRDA